MDPPAASGISSARLAAPTFACFLCFGTWPIKSRDQSSLQIFLFDPDSASVECLLGHDAVARYAVRCSIPFLIFAVFLGLYALSQLAGRFRSTLAWQREKTVNSICTVYQIVFIALTAIAALPFQCYTHPNGQKSVLVYPDILCYSEDHRPLVAMAMLVLVLIVVPFIALNVWATYKAYSASRGAGKLEDQALHLAYFRYLFFRFRPDVFWWGAPLSLRQLLLAFAPAVAPDDVGAQSIYVVAILLIYLAALCFFWPWKSHELNLLDASSVAALTMLMVAVSTLMPAAQPGGWQDGLSLVLTSWLMVTGAAFVAVAGYLMVRFGPSADFGLQAFSGTGREQLGADLHRLSTLLASLPPEQCKMLLDRMNTFDVQALSKAISSIQGASKCEIWISGSVFRRLCSVEHSRDSSSRLSNQFRESLRKSIAGGRTSDGRLCTSVASERKSEAAGLDLDDQAHEHAEQEDARRNSGVLLGSGLPDGKAPVDECEVYEV